MNNTNRIITPIDAFVVARLEQRGLTLSPPANRRLLARRLYFDLVGLPPTPEQMQRFLSDRSPNAYARLVDRLLSSPAYGQRWAQHWLDVVRYADSDGFEYDDPRPHAWRYRDWVIRSFNLDKPFDRFVREQIAADELYPAEGDSLAALGLHRLGPLRLNAGIQDEKKNRQEVLTEIVDAVGSAFLGITIGCARCHDHKFDPIAQSDYYRLQAFFAASESVDIPLSAVDGNKKPKDAVMAVLDGKHSVPDTFVLSRGEPHEQLERVDPGFPSALIDPVASIPPRFRRRSREIAGGLRESTGRRAALAAWLADENNPLTSRVFVNRVWHHHFGRGLISTPNDFGTRGGQVSHPTLLDWLAVEFVESGWSVKHLHRLITTSSVYRLASRKRSIPDSVFKAGHSVDPNNRLLWRGNRRRLEAEIIRDSLLAVAGELNRSAGGPGVRLPLPPEIAKLQYKGSWQPDKDPARRHRRTVYLFVKRNNRPPLLMSFDAPSTMVSAGSRTESAHAGQALALLNSPLLQQQAERLAVRLRQETGDEIDRIIDRAYRLVLARPARSDELQFNREFLERGTGTFAERLIDFCLVLFNLDEFIYID